MNGQLPPEIIVLKEKFIQAKKKFKSMIPLGIGILVLLIILPSVFFQIQPDQDGVIQRFGKYVRTVGPGLHFKLPLGIEKATKVRTRAILKQEFGFATMRAGVRTEYDRRNLRRYEDESIMLTGDLNVADVEWIAQYRITDPMAYLFNVRHVESNIRDLSEAVMRQVVGDRKVAEVLTYGRLDIEVKARDNLQSIMDYYETGVQIVTVKLQDVNPPDPVKPSFNEVNAANQESDQLVNEAWKIYNKIIPEARGKAERTVAVAEGYSVERINNAKGDAKRFEQLQKEYAKAPNVTKKRLYLETMKHVMDKVDQVYVIDPSLKSIVPLLSLGKTKE